MRLLFIEDDETSVQPVLLEIDRLEDKPEYKVIGFPQAEAELESWWPDMVILDLAQGTVGTGDEPSGLSTRDRIWRSRFCPIIVFTARPDMWDDGGLPHPFIRMVQKGSQGVLDLMVVFNEFRLHVESMRDVERKMRLQCSLALRNVAPNAFSDHRGDNDAIRDAILRGTRRRIAASADEPLVAGQKLSGWEQYLYPPVSDSIRLGDVLLRTDGDKNLPSSYRVVLTPSCDLEAAEGRKPKVANVLVAKCGGMSDALDRLQIGRPDSEEKRKDLQRLLSQGHSVATLFYPSLPGRFPHLAVDLRDLELIPFGRIGIEGSEHERVASVDSPFRELVAWAYMHTACRPGLPDRDLDKWVDGIVADCTGEPPVPAG